MLHKGNIRISEVKVLCLINITAFKSIKDKYIIQRAAPTNTRFVAVCSKRSIGEYLNDEFSFLL
jgi:hypothetical protein